MKKGFLSIVFSAVMLVVLSSCEENAASKVKAENVEAAAERDANANKFAKIEFEETEFDFGDIVKGTPQTHIFKLKNTGDVPLVVSNVKASCGCTTPQKPEGPIEPGETGEINVRFSGNGNGSVKKSVTITANTEQPTHVIYIKANILPAETK